MQGSNDEAKKVTGDDCRLKMCAFESKEYDFGDEVKEIGDEVEIGGEEEFGDEVKEFGDGVKEFGDEVKEIGDEKALVNAYRGVAVDEVVNSSGLQ